MAHRAAGPATVMGLALLLQLMLVVHLAQCQASEADEQFEAYHHDIGRISGGSQVAPASQLVARPSQHHQRQQLSDAAQLQPPPPLQTRARHPSAAPATQARKPNRITLVPRRDPTEQLAAPAQTLVAAQLPGQLEATFTPLAPSTQPIYSSPVASVQQQQQQQQQQQVAEAQQPALASFRSAGSSVSARHSALIAQVAAERAAAGALDRPLQPPPQPSIGSPLEALSSPAVAQVQAPQQPQLQLQPQSQLQPLAAPALTHASVYSAHQQQQQAQQQQQLSGQSTGFSGSFVNRPEEPLVAPSFEHVLGHGCPPKGVFSYENKDHCDRYYICTNGTFTEEACPNGLAYSQQGAVYQHCAYNWNVDCGRKKTSGPVATPGCPWQFGIFPIEQNGRCSIDYFVCEWGVPDTRRCTPEGLFYDDRIKGCQWADQLGCKSEALLNFKCPAEDEENPYWPYPRYYHNTQDVIVCVNEQPRLVHCNEDQLVDPGSLACIDVKKKKVKKF